ncbi:MAG: hypothetical protein ACRC8S_11290 [Fimbriiglobus sp.]
MNRNRFRKWACLLSLLALAGAGCSPGSLAWLLQDSKAKPQYPLPPIDKKKEVTVLVMVNKAPELGNNPLYATVDRELPGLIARQMVMDTKEDKYPIRTIDQSALEKFKSSSRKDWRTMSPALIGKELGADYVIDVNLVKMSVFQQELAKEFCQGRANLDVTVYITSQPEKIFEQYQHNSHQVEKSVMDKTPDQYRRWFTEHIAREIAWRHIPHSTDRRLSVPK